MKQSSMVLFSELMSNNIVKIWYDEMLINIKHLNEIVEDRQLFKELFGNWKMSISKLS